MNIVIKQIRGREVTVNVTQETKIADLKKQVEAELLVPAVQQTLIVLGTTLLDHETIGSLSMIQEGTTIIMVPKTSSFEDVLIGFLLKYYTEAQTERIVTECISDFQNTMRGLSLDDLEKIAKTYNEGKP